MNIKLPVTHVSAIQFITEYINDMDVGRIDIPRPKNDFYEFWFNLKQCAFYAIKAIRQEPDQPPLESLELLKSRFERNAFACKHEKHRTMFWQYCDAIDCIIDYIVGGFYCEN